MDILAREDLPFPQSLPEFQRVFPDDAACAAYLEKARWRDGFGCPRCGVVGEPFRFEARPGILRCRACRKNIGLMAGTVMERSHTPLSIWFWAAYLIASQTPGMSAVQFQGQLGLSRYETAFGILHKLRAGMVRPERDKIGGKPQEHVEADEPGSEDGPVAKAGASITRFSSLAPSRCVTASQEPNSTIGKTVATRDVFVSPSSPTAALIRFAGSSKTPSLPDRWSSPTNGAAMLAWESADSTTTQSQNPATQRSRKNSYQSSTWSLPT